MKKIVSTFAALALLLCAAPAGAGRAAAAQESEGSQPDMEVSDAVSYETFLEQYASAAQPAEPVPVDITAFTVEEGEADLREDYLGKEGVSLYTGEEGSVTFTVTVPAAGLYGLRLDFVAENQRGASVERKVLINGESPHQEAETLVFSRLYQDDPDGLGMTDTQGNDIRPSQVEVRQWQNKEFIRDSEGYYITPLLFYFGEGENTITFEATSEPLTIANLCLANEEARPTYAELQQEYAEKGYQAAGAEPIVFQGESAVLKSDPVLYPIVDRTTPTTVPYVKNLQKLNSIGGYRWQNPRQFIIWNFSVEEEGLYTLYIKARQNVTRGVKSNRAIYIDGSIPCKEMENYEVSFHSKWQLLEVGGEDGAFQIYLTPGEHQLKMEVTLGEMAPRINQVQNILTELNGIYTTIMMITGSKPDTMRDYYLDELIPDEIARMGELAGELQAVVDWFVEYTGGSGQNVSSLNTMIRQLRKMNAKPDDIARNLDYFKTNIGSLGTWLSTVQQQPLEIDYLAWVSSPDPELPATNAGYFQQIGYDVNQFIRSFIDDYSSIGSSQEVGAEQQVIKVWMSTGRDQVQSLRKIIDSSFTTQHNIGVELELVTAAALLPATVAGIGPDVALNMADTEPINYAIRNAVIDLTRFPDFEEVAARFLPERLVPMTFDGKVYALPETQTFNVLFYRKDVLNDIGLSVPNTWEDVIAAIPVLQKNNMSFAIPASSTTTPQAGVTSYYMMLYQNGGQLYKDNGKSSDMDSEVGLAAFRQWTNLYVNYDLPQEYNFLDRFRTGEYPLIIGDFTNFNSLSVSAPEIRGLWGFTLLPGTVQEDGTIDRSMSFAGTDCFILESSDNYEAAWEFLKWWTDAEAQIEYGNEMESVLGASARHPTANLEAFGQIAWSNELYNVLNEQMMWGRGVEQVPGAYFTGRHLDNAFRQVVINDEDAKETLFDYVYTINQELTGKRREFGLPVD